MVARAGPPPARMPLILASQPPKGVSVAASPAAVGPRGPGGARGPVSQMGRPRRESVDPASQQSSGCRLRRGLSAAACPARPTLPFWSKCMGQPGADRWTCLRCLHGCATPWMALPRRQDLASSSSICPGRATDAPGSPAPLGPSGAAGGTDRNRGPLECSWLPFLGRLCWGLRMTAWDGRQGWSAPTSPMAVALSARPVSARSVGSLWSPAQTSSETLALCSPHPLTSMSVFRLRQGCPCLVCKGWSEGWGQGHRQPCLQQQGGLAGCGWPGLRSRAGRAPGLPARLPDVQHRVGLRCPPA